MADDPQVLPPADEAVPAHRRTARNTGARAVLVLLAVVAVIAAGWWIIDALL